MKKILFIASHRKDRSPSQRFRFEQFFDYFEENGYQCVLSPIISDKDDIYLYTKGKYFKKFMILVKGIITRLKDVARAHDFDIVFIQREALFIGSSYFEKRFRKSGAKVIYDFDDSIWLGDTSEANKKLRWMKYPAKIVNIIPTANMIFAGNKYLADYALQYNSCVKIVPTTIDTSEHIKDPIVKKDDNKICIGWTGSITTIKHFENAIPFLRTLKKKYGDRLTIKLIGDKNYRNEELGIIGQEWNRETEIKELSFFDIGIMPLPDDEWTKGKCGLKGLQYMALEIPAIMSPIGVNSEIISDGVNGFLATIDQEWIDKISLLIDAPTLRSTIGKKARQTVIEKYSKESEKGNYLRWFEEVMSS